MTSAPAAARYAATWPGPVPTSTTGRPPARPATRPSSQRSNGLAGPARRRAARRTSPPPRRRPHAPSRRGQRLLRQHDLAVDGRPERQRRRGLGLDRPEEVYPPPVLLARPSFQLAHQRGGPFIGRGRQSSQHGLDGLAVGERVQPVGAGAQLAGACGPRSSRTVISARSSGWRASRSSSSWWYFSVRGPRSAHTTRTRPRSLRLRSVSVSSGWS